MLARLSLALIPLAALAACETATSGDASEVAAPAAEAAADIPEPAGLTSDQKLIWASMTPAAKAEAVAFIENGGTFAQFIAA